MLFVQQRGQFPIASSERLEWAEIGSLNFPENFQNMGVPRNRSHSSRISWEISWQKCFSGKNDLNPFNRTYFHPFRANNSNIEQGKKRKSNFYDNCPSVTNAIMVSTTFTTHNTNSITSAKIFRPLLGSNKEKHPWYSKETCNSRY